MIEVENLSKTYGKTIALDNVSFKINKGEVVGLLGPNGAGKTTTMKILTCFLSATAGKALIDGLDVFENPDEVRSRIGYLPESNPLYLDMIVREYLEFGANVRKIYGSKQKAAVERVVASCDLSKVVHRRIGHLSKGYRQRTGLAQALLHDPKILILDEPTSGLDPNQIRDILKLISELGQEKTVIHSTHILGEVETTSDRVLIINNGKIVAQGSPQELMQRSSGRILYLTVKGEKVSDTLKASHLVKSVDPIGTLLQDWQRFAIQSVENQDIAEAIFALAVEKKWSLRELNSEAASLEDVFAKLTRGQ